MPAYGSSSSTKLPILPDSVLLHPVRTAYRLLARTVHSGWWSPVTNREPVTLYEQQTAKAQTRLSKCINT